MEQYDDRLTRLLAAGLIDELPVPTESNPPTAERPCLDCCFRCWSVFLEYSTSEFLLTKWKLPNGSGVIVLRALLTSTLIYAFLLVARNLIEPGRTWQMSWPELRRQLIETGSMYGVIFAGLYAGLYARFSSQFTYLANVYNQIKAAQCREKCEKLALADWKAAFIEDAEDMHVATKPMFASIIRAWGSEVEVEQQFLKNAPRGSKRFGPLMRRVRRACQ